MKCPDCGRIHPETAERCECGHEFIVDAPSYMISDHSGETVLEVVSKGKRFLNFIIDYIAFLICLVVLFMFFPSLALEARGSNELLEFFLSAAAMILYYSIFEMLFQRTPGKLLTGTKVVMRDGSKPSLDAIIARSLIRLVPFEAISGLFSNGNLWWHDSWSKTRVVSAKERTKVTGEIEGEIVHEVESLELRETSKGIPEETRRKLLAILESQGVSEYSYASRAIHEKAETKSQTYLIVKSENPAVSFTEISVELHRMGFNIEKIAEEGEESEVYLVYR